MKKIVDYIGSRRFAIILLVVTVLVILLSNLLPDLYLMNQAEIEAFKTSRPNLFKIVSLLQIQEVVRNPLFLTIPFFIFCSITVCTIKRVRQARKRNRKGIRGGGRIEADGSFDLEKAVQVLKNGKWDVSRETSTEGMVVVARKGKHGFWGSVLFHVGMNVAIAGIVASIIYSFTSMIILTEGYGINFESAVIGNKFKETPFDEVILNKFKTVYKDGFPVDHTIDISLVKDGIKTDGLVKVNQPLYAGGYQFAAMRHGFSPRFVLKRGKNLLMDSYTNLVVMTPDKVDNIIVPGENITIDTQFFPDHYEEGSVPKTHSREPKNPVFFVNIHSGETVLGRGFLPMNKEVKFSGYSLEFKDLKMWVTLGMSKDPGMPVVAVGFVLIVVGLLIRFVLNDRSIWITKDRDKVMIGGKSSYFPALFDEEFDNIIKEME